MTSKVEVQQVVRIDFAMQLGQTTQAVEVSGGAPLLNTDSSTLGRWLRTSASWTCR